ncbi:MAG: LemA family protein [Ilumatobacteraceae bacterium]
MIAALIAVGVVVLLAAAGGWVCRGLVQSRNRCNATWSEVDVELARRHGVIPNLVVTVKGYAAHEREILDAVVNARNRAVSSAQSGSPALRAAAENLLTAALKRLFALAEAYPELKANRNFEALQEELAVTDDRAAFAGQFFNDAVMHYNIRLQTMPRNLIAVPLRFTEREFFVAEPGAPAPTVVQF